MFGYCTTLLVMISAIVVISTDDTLDFKRQRQKLKAILMLPSHVVATKRCMTRLLEKSSNNTALANRVRAQSPCPNFLATIESIQPVVDLAVKDMYYKYQTVQSPGWMHVLPIDVDCGNQTEAAQGFLEAREQKGGVNVIFGPATIVCRYPEYPFIPTIPLPRPSRYPDHDPSGAGLLVLLTYFYDQNKLL
uniref:Uncharacterized protein n=1 Tax=Romanomermis culicivorax TaxID=13658 RepID=A0A915IXE2_ROMCU